MNCYGAVRDCLRSWGTHPVLVEQSSESAFREVDAAGLGARVEQIAGLLGGAGVREGQVVALFLGNSVEFVCAFLALLRMQAVPAPLMLDYRSTELQEIFANAQPAAVITEAAHLSLIEEHLRGAAVFVRQGAELSLLRRGEAAAGAPPPAGTASINYTYRGTGRPLGALVPHGQYLHGAEALQGGLQGRGAEKMLVVLPLAHIFPLVGCLFVPLLYGMTAVICPSLHPRRLFAAMAAHGTQYLTAVPELLRLLCSCRRAGPALPELKAFVCGGSLLSAQGYEAARSAFGVELMHGYGLTEFAPVARNVRGSTRAGTVGPVVRGVQCRIRSAAPDRDGEIQFRCPTMATGYYGDPQEYAAASDEGWFRTGDEGHFEGDHLVFVRELKQTCKVNGNMVDLAEVRRLMLSFAGVEAADVQPAEGGLSARIRKDHRMGPAEFAAELRRFMLQRIAAYKVPSRISCL